MIYLNQAGTSWPKPTCVREAAAAALETPPELWDAQLAAQQRQVAGAFGIADPERLLLTPGATSALALALADLPWRAGDAIVTSGFEHHALHRPAAALAQRGVELRVAPPSDAAPVCLEHVEDALRGGRVRVVAVTTASNVTGDLLPIAPLVALAHHHDALVLVDAAQTAGWLPIDAAEVGADLLAFAGHKGPHGLWGIGGLYVAPGVAMASPRGAMPGYCDAGSVDRVALAGLAAGLPWMAQQVTQGALARGRQQVDRLRSALLASTPARVLGAASPDARVPTLAFTLPGRAATAIASQLAQRGLVASGGMQCAPLAHQTLGTAPEGVVRLSVGPLLAEERIDEACDVLVDSLAGAGAAE